MYVPVDVTTVVFVVVAQPGHDGRFVVKIGEHMAASLSVRFTAVTGTGPIVYVAQGRVRVTVTDVLVVYVRVGSGRQRIRGQIDGASTV